MNLQQLRQIAYRLDLTDEDVSAWGKLGSKATWEAAINAAAIEEPEQVHPMQKSGAIVTAPAALVASVWTVLTK